eukprot:jgi/Tetstr1/429441/TSEL_019351.t1
MAAQMHLPELPGEVVGLVLDALSPTWLSVLRHVSPSLRTAVQSHENSLRRRQCSSSYGPAAATLASGYLNVADLCAAAQDGETAVALLEWALQQGCTPSVASAAAVARGCRTAEMSPPCPWDERATAAASQAGHLSTLQYLRAEGCAWNALTARRAAGAGHLEVLKWAKEEGCPWNENTVSAAARGGHLAVLQWLRGQGCPWSEWTAAKAAAGGHLAALQWLQAAGCPWDKWTCTCAAQGGHLEVLAWARRAGCPWDKWTCQLAASEGHLHVLQYARRHGCPWDGRTLLKAAANGHMHILRWALANGCPVDKDACAAALDAEQGAALVLLQQSSASLPATAA